ncbi:MAG: hypothetical protein JW958_03735 [Candidatus Eisenbacteria bacterium]|nr:hypothetical protein [Candidatus Eisenbacteria bacterium]
MFHFRRIHAGGIAAATALLLTLSCGDDGGPAGPVDEPEASAAIGPSGGTLTVEDSSSVLYGVRVDVPAGALSSERTVSLDVGSAPSLPQMLTGASTAFRLDLRGADGFDKSITIHIPYEESGIVESGIVPLHANIEDGSWEVAALSTADSTENTISLTTKSTGWFQVAAYPSCSTLPSQSNLSFDPAQDKLTHPNNQKSCYGECAFVKWYWEQHGVAGTPLSTWKTTEHASIALYTHWVCHEHTSRAALAANQIDDRIMEWSLRLQLAVLQEPVLLGFEFWNSNVDAMDGHAVLVYNYEVRTEGDVEYTFFSVYDNNIWSGQTHTKSGQIVWDGDSLFYGDSGGQPYYPQRSRFGLVGSPDWVKPDFVYEYFLHPPAVTNPAPTGAVSEPDVTLSAEVHYPYYEEDRVQLTVDGNPVEDLTVLSNGPNDFALSADLSLADGVHEVRVVADNRMSECSSSPSDDIPPADGTWTFTINANQHALIGTWDLVSICSEDQQGFRYCVPRSEIAADPLTYIFNPDGSAVQIYQEREADFSWWISGNMLYTGSGSEYEYSVDSNTLILGFSMWDTEMQELYWITHEFDRRN